MRSRLACAIAATVALTAAACTNGASRTTTPSAASTPGSTSPSPIPSPTRTSRSPVPLSRVRVRLEKIASLEAPVAMAARRHTSRLYVAEQGGRVIAIGGGRKRTVVLNISSDIAAGGEQGLLGLAFSPNGAELVVNYTDRAGDTHVADYSVHGDQADPHSFSDLVKVDQPFPNHNGGQLAFGPDHRLYIALGDGGAGGDPFGNGQSLRTLLGKILRIDPRPYGARPHRIPPDNPFVGKKGALPEIWDYGLRNPWRFSFDRKTGDLWIGDVGQSSREEIDFEPAGSKGGRNYGWNLKEGTLPFASGGGGAHTVPPIYEYETGRDGTCAVVGGFVYRGERISGLEGAYVFADFCQGRIMALRQKGGKVVEHRALGPVVPELSSFGQDNHGELYVLSLDGPVYRLEPK